MTTLETLLAWAIFCLILFLFFILGKNYAEIKSIPEWKIIKENFYKERYEDLCRDYFELEKKYLEELEKKKGIYFLEKLTRNGN